MLGRLRLLKRFSTFHHHSLLHTPTPTPITNISVLFSPTTFITKPTTQTHPIHHLKQQKQLFSTRATQTDEATTPSSLFTPYVSVRIQCTSDVADILSEALLCFGANSASMEELDSCDDLHDTWITSIFADDADVHTCISHAADSIGLNYIPSYKVSMVEQCDWVTKTQENFHPIEVTDDLWIVPKWRTPPDSQATNIILDPGLAFGTGEHPTTKLCLLLLHGLMKGGEHFLDYGTGSGVLGIAAVKMGATLSVGVDIDPQAVTSARQNIALNGIDSNKMLIYLVPGDVSFKSHNNPQGEMFYKSELVAARENFDIVIANILLNPLMNLAEEIVAFGKPGAVIGLSGILSEQVQQIKELYSKYLDNISVSEMDGWACLHGTRKGL